MRRTTGEESRPPAGSTVSETQSPPASLAYRRAYERHGGGTSWELRILAAVQRVARAGILVVAYVLSAVLFGAALAMVGDAPSVFGAALAMVGDAPSVFGAGLQALVD